MFERTMVFNTNRARAKVTRGDKTCYFCSENCRDRFERDADAYLDQKLYSSQS